MTIIYFTRNTKCTSDKLFVIKGKEVKLTQSAKILGVVIDVKLRYKEHMARAVAKGLSAAICKKAQNAVASDSKAAFYSYSSTNYRLRLYRIGVYIRDKRTELAK